MFWFVSFLTVLFISFVERSLEFFLKTLQVREQFPQTNALIPGEAQEEVRKGLVFKEENDFLVRLHEYG